MHIANIYVILNPFSRWKESFITCLNSLISGTVLLDFSTIWESGFESRGYWWVYSSTYHIFTGRKSGEILFESRPDRQGGWAGLQTEIWSLLRWSRDWRWRSRGAANRTEDEAEFLPRQRVLGSARQAWPSCSIQERPVMRTGWRAARMSSLSLVHRSCCSSRLLQHDAHRKTILIFHLVRKRYFSLSSCFI